MDNCCLTKDRKTLVFGCKTSIIPEGVIEIEWNAFKGCTGLTFIEIPNSVTKVKQAAFRGCTRLKSIEIPDSVTRIGLAAFAECIELKSIDIPDSVTVIEDDAFGGCTGLERIDVDNNNMSYCSVNNCCLSKDGEKLIFGCKSSIIPESVREIESFAFRGCTGLDSIEIPDNVTAIKTHAFEDCTGLTSIEFPDNVTVIGHDAFSGCTGIKQVILNINKKKPAESEAFINRVLDAFDSHVKLTVHIPIGTGYAYRHYPHFDQDRLEFIPCIRPKRID